MPTLYRFAPLLAAAAVGAVLAGWLGALALALAGALVALLRHERMIDRLGQWAAGSGVPLPPTTGAWGDVFTALERKTFLAAERQRELETAVERFRRAAEALPEGVVILDARRRIEWINHHAERCLRLIGDRDIGSPIANLLREPDFVAFIDAATPGSALEMRSQRYAGQLMQFQLAPFAGDRLLLLVRDVTQLDRLATMRRDFVANVSHELKTPLTVTLGFLETAQDALADTPPEEIAGYLRMAEEQARRMRRLIDDLLTLSGLETDAPPLDEELAPNDLVAEVAAEARALSGGQHIVEVRTDGPPRLRGGARELHSALLNLASNAVRYTPVGGRVEIGWHAQENGGGEFRVSDSGIGIAAEHLPRITERFYRVDRGRSRDSGGTGLGLAIVKHVLERHGAELRVESEAGRGSTFRAIFPPSRVPN